MGSAASVLGALMLMTAMTPIALTAERAWTRSDILAIADAEAKRLGYDVDHMGVAFDIYNSLWNARAANRAASAPADLLKQLEGRRYFAVYYSLMKEPMIGGDLFVFIDRTTSHVLGVFQGT